ncbi:MAG: potassium-transporting ATPase subunit KdpB [Candidatus Thermoplasmatota archaeon]|jgi:K+-transporting ATPase ATPase B chain|nr:potassium-transporting ATPase subunit KdpB [Candidatus Thermoplasmatota archaeon]MCL5790460.1 potassium-transporting ATPase subunit KdpB [Candidatus Thermoplasmatota archaeon]
MNQYAEASINAIKEFDPRKLLRNPVMFITELAMLTSVYLLAFHAEYGLSLKGVYVEFYISVIVLLFMTIFFSNLAETLAEGKSRNITATLKRMKKDTTGRVIDESGERVIPSGELRKGMIVEVRKDETVPTDGEIVEGRGYFNESSITGESKPVFKVQGDSVTGATILLDNRVKIRITANPGETFLDKMIELVEGSIRAKTPNEIALSILLSGLTLVFLIITSSVYTLGTFLGTSVNLFILVVLLICLIPTTIGALLPALGVAAINKVSQFNVIAKSGRAVENAGDIDTIILDKTGTITIGDREANKVYPNRDITENELFRAAYISSFFDETKEGISVVRKALEGNPEFKSIDMSSYEFVPFSPDTKFSGVKKGNEFIYKGSPNSIWELVGSKDNYVDAQCAEISSRGGTAMVVISEKKILGAIEFNDILKPWIRERIEALKSMNIKPVMCTGDNELTAQYIAREASIDEVVANSKPKDKYNKVQEEKEKQRMVAMVGDGTNDAPALALADVGFAMNSGTQAAKDAANMIDLENDPTKLMDVIFLGKQILITRGSLTTFSIANDISKYFVIIPAVFFMFPQLSFINILGFTDPLLAVTSALIFNTFIIPLLIPLAIRGVKFKPSGINDLLRRNIIVYGVGGVLLPFIAIGAIYYILMGVGVLW